jgi:hypothetical protein
VARSRLPELDVERVRRWCSQRVPEHLRDQVRVECDAGPGHLTIVECRPPWRKDMGAEWTRFPIARLRYTKAAKRWSLYLLARPQPAFPPVRSAPAVAPHRRPPAGGRPRPHRHLLGIAASALGTHAVILPTPQLSEDRRRRAPPPVD